MHNDKRTIRLFHYEHTTCLAGSHAVEKMELAELDTAAFNRDVKLRPICERHSPVRLGGSHPHRLAMRTAVIVLLAARPTDSEDWALHFLRGAHATQQGGCRWSNPDFGHGDARAA